MKNVLYTRVLVPAGDSPSGEDPTIIRVTEEVNCILVWLSSFSTEDIILADFCPHEKSTAIEWAVLRAHKDKRVKRAVAADNYRANKQQNKSEPAY